MELREILDTVCELPTFLEFDRQLKTDRETAASKKLAMRSPNVSLDGWETTTMESFLEGAIAWAEETQCGESQGLSPVLPWHQFAMFHAATIHTAARRVVVR